MKVGHFSLSTDLSFFPAAKSGVILDFSSIGLRAKKSASHTPEDISQLLYITAGLSIYNLFALTLHALVK